MPDVFTSIPSLIAELESRAIILSLSGGEIRYRSPKDALTQADRESLRARRGEIVAYLLARDAGKMLRTLKGRAGPLTASIAQEMWWRFGGGPDEGKPVALNIGMIGTFPQVEGDVLADAIRQVIARHDTLRTHIEIRGEELLLSLNAAEDFRIETEDLRGLGKAEAHDAAQAQARDYCSQLNPVASPWLTRARLFLLPGGDALAAISCSHIVADAGSRNILLGEIEDILSGKPPAPSVPYNDFSLAERDFFDSAQGAQLIEYWRQWYGAQPVMHAPTTGVPLLWGAGTRNIHNFIVPRRVVAKARALAADRKVTAFLVHLTIFSLALARWSGTDRFPVRILGDKRTSLELSHTIGLMFCADAVEIQAAAGQDFEAVMRAILTEYDSSLSLRVPTLHYYPPQCVRPGIESIETPNKIPAVFNYYAGGTVRERHESEAAPDFTAAMPWPPAITRVTQQWTRRSAPVFLHLVDEGARASASLHFYADVVGEADQQAFIATLFQTYSEILPD